MNALRQWLTTLITATMLLTLLQSLTPEGTVRRVSSFVGSLLLLTVLLQPVIRWEKTDWQLSNYALETAQLQEQLENQQQETLAARIAELTNAYISDKAAALGISGEVLVKTHVNPDGNTVPWSVELWYPYSAELAEWIGRELDIPAERQVWYGQDGKN